MSRSFVTAAALLAVLTSPALAQDAPTPAPEAPAASASGSVTLALPQVLRDAGLTDFDIRPTRHGSRVKGNLPDGTQLNGLMDDKGALRGVRVEGDAVLPPALLEQLVPAPVRDQALFGELGKVKAVFLGPEGVMVAGVDAKDKPVRAGFASDGTLMRFERGGPRDGGMGPLDRGPKGDGPDGPGPRGKGPQDHDGKGPRADKDRHDGERRDGERRDRPRHDGDRKDADRHDRQRGDSGRGDSGRGDGAGTPPTPDQVRASLTEAGYTGLGQILQQGPVTVAQATNPEGEPVLVELGVDGEILRELNR